MHATPKDWGLLVALGFVWGASFPATKVATADFLPFTLAAFRIALAAAALLGVLLLSGRGLPGISRARDRTFWAFAIAVGFLSNALPFSSLGWGQRHIDSGLAGVLMATVPLFVLPLSHAFVPGERLTLRRIAGFLLGFGGVLVLLGPAALESLDDAGRGWITPLAIGACLVTAFGYASGSVMARLAPDEYGRLRFGAAALLAGAVISLPVAFAVEDPVARAPSAEGLLALVYLGIVPTALATLMLLSVIASAGPAFLANVNYQVPLWAVGLGAALLGETPSPRLGIALVLILVGLAVAQDLPGRRRERPAAE
jgi:drug/metabolite transporter (DMT)-like permease